ncbi:MAG TPA: hypothetical protein VFF63_03755 [Candidatus Babeliales bacterium]|nr:hypothetical protein [Candidatus Babeliales bacterium]
MDSVAAHRVAVAVEGLLLAPILRPMIDGAGVLGDYELDLLAQEIAGRDDRGFAALLAANLERRS